MAAAMSTDGLILAIANAISHDVYYKMIDPAETAKRLLVARVLLANCGFAGATIAAMESNLRFSNMGFWLCDVWFVLATSTWCMVEELIKRCLAGMVLISFWFCVSNLGSSGGDS